MQNVDVDPCTSTKRVHKVTCRVYIEPIRKKTFSNSPIPRNTWTVAHLRRTPLTIPVGVGVHARIWFEGYGRNLDNGLDFFEKCQFASFIIVE
jgi:hypothetical protein